MQPYQDRAVEEKRELDVKLNDLTTFIEDPESEYKKIPAEEQRLLLEQARAMGIYSNILMERIALFKDDGVAGDKSLEGHEQTQAHS